MRLGALRKRKSVLGNDTVDPKVAAFSEIASCVLQVRLVQLATHALCVYQCVCLVRLWDTRSCLVKTRSQRVNRHTKPQNPSSAKLPMFGNLGSLTQERQESTQSGAFQGATSCILSFGFRRLVKV